MIRKILNRRRLIQVQTNTMYLSPASNTSNSESQNDMFQVNSNVSWTAISESSWLTITSGNSGNNTGIVDFSITENTENSDRNGTIRVEGGGLTRYFNLVQQVFVSTVPPSVITSENPGLTSQFTNFSFQIEATDADTYGASGLPDGLSINKSTGLISGSLTDIKEEYPIIISATNEGGTTTKNIVFKFVESLEQAGLPFKSNRSEICTSSVTGQYFSNGSSFSTSNIVYTDVAGTKAPAGYFRIGSTVYYYDGQFSLEFEGSCPLN